MYEGVEKSHFHAVGRIECPCTNVGIEENDLKSSPSSESCVPSLCKLRKKRETQIEIILHSKTVISTKRHSGKENISLTLVEDLET